MLCQSKLLREERTTTVPRDDQYGTMTMRFVHCSMSCACGSVPLSNNTVTMTTGRILHSARPRSAPEGEAEQLSQHRASIEPPSMPIVQSPSGPK